MHVFPEQVGLCLSMQSDEHQHDPAPEFPDWLADAKVVREIARLGECEETPEKRGKTGSDALSSALDGKMSLDDELLRETPWPDAPELLRREMIASTQDSESFGWYLEFTAWKHGTSAARRQAFVADGASVNWTIHRKHFSQMTGVLDLMHASSYAHLAAKELNQPGTYRRFAEGIWQGRVDRVIDELLVQADQFPLPDNDSDDSDPRKHTRRAELLSNVDGAAKSQPDWSCCDRTSRYPGMMLTLRDHQSRELFDPWAHLGDKRRRLLELSWAGVFREYLLECLPVNELAVGFRDGHGRPSKDLSVALGALILQQLHDLTDQQTTEAVALNIAWHYALDIRHEPDAYLCERTLRNYRRRLLEVGLDEVLFRTLTDRLIETVGVDTHQQRLDSTTVSLRTNPTGDSWSDSAGDSRRSDE